MEENKLNGKEAEGRAVKELAHEMKKHLQEDIIPFWQSLKDAENGGWYGQMDYNLETDKMAAKGCILNSRILWFFSEAALVLQDKSLLTDAEHSYRFLRECFLDRKFGGLYWSVKSGGAPEDTAKHTYNQAFGIYALASYHEASGDRDALALAVELFQLIEEKCTDEEGYLEAFDREFNPEPNKKLSENGVLAYRTMNTLLHVFEAYTQLYRVWPKQCVRERLLFILDIFWEKVYNPALCRLEVFFDQAYNSLSDIHSYGHDIEASWLLDNGIEALGGEKAQVILSMTGSLARQVLREAFDGRSLANESEKGVKDEHRIWWVQAEAAVGFLNAYEREPDRKEYLEAALREWEFIRDFLIDSRKGSEWFWEVSRQGEPYEGRPIVEPWKCPYHNGRMCMEIIRRAQKLGKGAFTNRTADKSAVCRGISLHGKYRELLSEQEKLLCRKNMKSDSYNGIFDRYEYPVLTRDHIPLTWRYDLNPETNPYFQERLGVNAVMNAGAVVLDGKYYLVARIEGYDRKSFFGVAKSDNGVDGFRFLDYPVVLKDICQEETNVYDMRLTRHEDGYIYGVFCSESKDRENCDLSAAVAAAGIVRTRDLKCWERLDNLITLRSPQQRNVVLHPEFVDGKYAFYTRPMDGFLETGSGGGIGFGLCEDIAHAVIEEERLTSIRRYHTITEVKNGAGAPPIKTDRGWIHIAHGVRGTAAGLRYVIYAFATDLSDPGRVIAEPSGYLIAPRGKERVGDVSNVVFTNGAVVNERGQVFIYYASSDTRLHVAVTDLDRLIDYVFRTPGDPGRSAECVAQRCELIDQNLKYLAEEREKRDWRE